MLVALDFVWFVSGFTRLSCCSHAFVGPRSSTTGGEEEGYGLLACLLLQMYQKNVALSSVSLTYTPPLFPLLYPT